MSTEGPVRAWRLTLKMDADSRNDLVRGLFNLMQAIERDEATTGVWGSPTNGCIYELVMNAQQTHDNYFREIRDYLDRVRTGGKEETK